MYRNKNLNPYQLIDTEISVDGIPNKMGLYIIDLQS